MKHRHTDKTINDSNHGEYVFIEEVEAHLTKSFQGIIHKKLRSLFKSQQASQGGQEEYEITIFVASHRNVDDKINRINKRILRNLDSSSQQEINKRKR